MLMEDVPAFESLATEASRRKRLKADCAIFWHGFLDWHVLRAQPNAGAY
jgi:hypothetical protein